MGVRRRRRPLPRHVVRVLRDELRSPPSRPCRGRARASSTSSRSRAAPFPTTCSARTAPQLTAICGKEAAVLMNTGAEAVETAIKVARRWGYERKGIARERGHDHRVRRQLPRSHHHDRRASRPTPSRRRASVRSRPGFRRVPYGDLDAVASAIDDTVAAILVEPIQGEAGVVIPPAGIHGRPARPVPDLQRVADRRRGAVRLRPHRQHCSRATTTTWCPTCTCWARRSAAASCRLSAVVANWDVLDVLTPGSHGSTFGGNPLACAVGLAVIDLVRDGTIVRATQPRSNGQLRDRLAVAARPRRRRRCARVARGRASISTRAWERREPWPRT